MNLGKLKEVIDLTLARDPSKVEDTIAVLLAQSSIGGSAKVEIVSVMSGFDWDSGFFLFSPANPVLRKPDPVSVVSYLVEDPETAFLYHMVNDAGAALCGKEPVLRTRIPAGTWGYRTFPQENFCKKCERIKWNR